MRSVARATSGLRLRLRRSRGERFFALTDDGVYKQSVPGQTSSFFYEKAVPKHGTMVGTGGRPLRRIQLSTLQLFNYHADNL